MPLSNTCTIGCKLPLGIVLTVQQTPTNATYPIAQPTTITLANGSNSNICYTTWLAWVAQENSTVAGAGVPGFPSLSFTPPGPILSGPNDNLTVGNVYLISVP